MGYRNYIYVVEKKKAEKVRHKTFEELEKLSNEKDDYFGFIDIRDIVDGTCAIELGKYVDFDIKPYIKPFFTDEDLHKRCNTEEEFMLLDPSVLQAMATYYKDVSRNYFSDLLQKYKDDKEIGSNLLVKELKTRIAFMDNLDYISKNKFTLCDTWLKDYDLLNFVYLAKVIDFNKYYLLWLGW